MAAKSVNTNKKYECYYNRFEKWCSMFPEASSFPYNESFVTLHLVSLIQTGGHLCKAEC